MKNYLKAEQAKKLMLENDIKCLKDIIVKSRIKEQIRNKKL